MFATLMAIKEKVTSLDNDLVDVSTFRSIVDGLQYLTFTRPDIIHAVNKVCQFFNTPTMVHLKRRQ